MNKFNLNKLLNHIWIKMDLNLLEEAITQTITKIFNVGFRKEIYLLNFSRIGNNINQMSKSQSRES